MKTLREYELKKGSLAKFHKLLFLLSSIRSTSWKCMENNLLLNLLSSEKLRELSTQKDDLSDFESFYTDVKCNEREPSK